VPVWRRAASGRSHCSARPAAGRSASGFHRCRACAVEAGLLDHHDRVQREEARLRQASRWAWTARRLAIWGLVVAATGVLLAVVDLVGG
jgi:hypothetical protein